MKKIIFISFVTAFVACGKEGSGGKASIHGYAKHHALSIPGTTIYIKYGAKESPGTNPSLYDASVKADSKAYYEFVNLKRGDYYLYGVGYDSTIAAPVIGGIPVQIEKSNSVVPIDVPITE